MFTNQTADQLNAMRCTSSGIFNSQNSIWMKANFLLVYSLALITFIASIKALCFLKSHHVYSNGSRILLVASLLTANLNQAVFLEIKIRQFVHILKYSDDPCQIEFASSECIYDNTIYIATICLSTWLLFGLTFDRFLAFFVTKFYKKYSKITSFLIVIFSIIMSIVPTYIVVGNVSRAGYVPSCNYAPQLSLSDLKILSNSILVFVLFILFLTAAILIMTVRKDNRIRHSVYDVAVRYASSENVLTTKSLCSIATMQFLFTAFSSASLGYMRFIESEISEEVFHIAVQYFTGPIYTNLSLPIVILYKTKKCIESRKEAICKMRSQTLNSHSHILSLKNTWA